MRISGVAMEWEGWQFLPSWHFASARVGNYRRVVWDMGPVTVSFGIYY